MSTTFPETVDAWRMVQARRHFAGELPFAKMSRLLPVLADPQGSARFEIQFERDEFGIASIALRVDASLSLTCQRTLEPFAFPVTVATRLGLITKEEDEAALPEGYEPLLTTDGELKLAEVIEDELLLALPVVPLSPGAEGEAVAWSTEAPEDVVAPENPFAVLKQFKKS